MKLPSHILLASAGILALTACVPATGQMGQRQAAGAATGALVGAAIGATAPGDSRLGQAAAGAVLGGALGSVVGSALDRQAAALQGTVSGNTKVVNTGSEIRVTMPQDILFALNSAQLRPDLRRDLDAVATNLIQYPNSSIEIVGHTDNTGPLDFNNRLSLDRANAVAGVLRQGGVPSSRIATIGRGPSQPIASNDTAEGRAQNRRVDIIIHPTNL